MFILIENENDVNSVQFQHEFINNANILFYYEGDWLYNSPDSNDEKLDTYYCITLDCKLN